MTCSLRVVAHTPAGLTLVWDERERELAVGTSDATLRRLWDDRRCGACTEQGRFGRGRPSLIRSPPGQAPWARGLDEHACHDHHQEKCACAHEERFAALKPRGGRRGRTRYSTFCAPHAFPDLSYRAPSTVEPTRGSDAGQGAREAVIRVETSSFPPKGSQRGGPEGATLAEIQLSRAVVAPTPCLRRTIADHDSLARGHPALDC